jgi:Flp pilus assembly protein TadG
VDLELALIRNFRTLFIRQTKRLASQDDGVTAIEFALLALPFFALIGAILETGMFLLGSQIFDSAVDDAARLIMIGEAKSYSAADFRTKVCERTFGLINCPGIKLRTRPIANFAVADTTPPVDENGDWILVEQFAPGNSRQVILVEAYYKWNTFLGFDFGFSKYGSSLIISSARVFMNEPF